MRNLIKSVKLKTDGSSIDTDDFASALKHVCCGEGKKYRGHFDHG